MTNNPSSEARVLGNISYGSEDDLIVKMVVPFLKLLGYNDNQIAIKFPVKAYRPGRAGRKPEADCVLFAGSDRSLDGSLVVVEVKSDPEATPEEQARFYSANLFVPFYLAWRGYEFDVYQLQAFKPPRYVETFSLRQMSEELFARAKAILSADLIHAYCRAHEIKAFDVGEELRKEEAQYVQKCLERLRYYRLLDLARPLDLLQTFVPVHIKVLESGTISAEKIQDTVHEGAHPKTIEQQFRTPPKPVLLTDEVHNVKTVALIGDPGSGKTTLLKHLCTEICQAATTRIPFFVPVRQLIAESTGIRATMRSHLAQCCSEQFADIILATSLKEGRLVLCLDGLDELDIEEPVAARQVLRKMAAELEEFRTNNADNLIVFTCRRESWPTCRSSIAVASHDYEVLPLSAQSVRAFVNNWFGADGSTDAAALLANFRKTGWPEFSTNPLLLGLTCIVFEKRKRVPDRRYVLYQRCLEVLLEEWDATRRLSRLSPLPQVSSEHMLDLLEDIALHFHRQHRACFLRQDVIKQLSSTLPCIGLTESDDSAAFDALSTQHGLLRSWSIEGLWAFPHLCFQEYLAARALRNDGNAVTELLLKKDDPHWREVITLYAQIGDATGLVQGLLRLSDNILYTNLFLAVTCVGHRTKLHDKTLRSEICSRLWGLTQGQNYYLLRKAVDALYQLNTPESFRCLRKLARDPNGALISSSYATRYLVAHEGAKAAQDLIQHYVAGEFGHDHLVDGLDMLPLEITLKHLEYLITTSDYSTKKEPGKKTITHHRRGRAVKVLARIGEARALPILKRLLMSESLDPHVRGWYITRAIASIPDHTVPDELLAILRDEGMLVDSRVNAASALGLEEPTAKAYLINLVADKNANHYDRRDAASTLCQFDLTDEDIQPLKSLLFDQRPEIFWGGPANAAKAIAKIGTHTAREVLVQALELWRQSGKEDVENIVDRLERICVLMDPDESIERVIFKSKPGHKIIWDMPDLMVAFFKQKPTRAEVLFVQELESHKDDCIYGGTRAFGIANAMLRLPPKHALIASFVKLALRVQYRDDWTWEILEQIWERRDLPAEVRELFYVKPVAPSSG